MKGKGSSTFLDFSSFSASFFLSLSEPYEEEKVKWNGLRDAKFHKTNGDLDTPTKD